MYCTDVSDMVSNMYKTKFGQRLYRNFEFFVGTRDSYSTVWISLQSEREVTADGTPMNTNFQNRISVD
jgi:hypothetical protein